MVEAGEGAGVEINARILRQSAGAGVESLPGTLEAACAESDLVVGETEASEKRPALAQAYALEAFGIVAGILDPRLLHADECGAQPRARDGEQRAEQHHALLEDALIGHGGQPIEAATAGKAHEQRLCLVVLGVRRDDGHRLRRGEAARKLGEQAIAGRPRGVLNAGRRLAARPRQDRMLKPQSARFACHPLRFRARGLAQCVVDGGDNELRRLRRDPCPT